MPHAETLSVPAPAQVARLLRTRRTIHLFKPEKPPHDIVLEALRLARWAPNHRLTEPWRFYLLGDETAEAIARRNAELVAAQRGANAGQKKLERWRAMPGWLAVTAQRSDDAQREREDYAATCCAVQNFQLYLWSHGIGVKWTTGDVTRDPRFAELVGFDPEAERLVGLLWYGYPAEVPQTQRKPLGEVLRIRD